MVTLAWRGCVARQEPYIPGALSILQGTVPGRVRGSGHMVPTYFRRCSGIECFNGYRGFALLIFAPAGLLPQSISTQPSYPANAGYPVPAASRLVDERSGIPAHPLSRMMTPNLTSRMSATSKAE